MGRGRQKDVYTVIEKGCRQKGGRQKGGVGRRQNRRKGWMGGGADSREGRPKGGQTTWQAEGATLGGQWGGERKVRTSGWAR